MNCLNIYINGDDCYNIPQLIDYSEHKSGSDFSLFFIKRKYPDLPACSNSMMFDFPHNITSDWFDVICRFASKINAQSVRVHSAIHYAEEINFPLVQAFQSQVNAGLVLSFFLYETSLFDVVCRRDFNVALNSGLDWQYHSKNIKKKLISCCSGWNASYNYLFNEITHAQYYFYDIYKNNQNIFFSSSHFHYIKDDCNNSNMTYSDILSILGIDGNVISMIREVCDNHKTLFFVDDGAEHTLGAVSKDNCILQEIKNEEFEFAFLLNYKGSLQNGVYSGVNVFYLPESITLEILSLAGIPLHNVYGFCSPMLFINGKNAVKKVFLHENESHAENIFLKLYLDIICYHSGVVFINETQKRIDEQYNPKKVFILAESMGDILFAAGGLNALRDHMRGPFSCIVPKHYHDLLSLCPWVDELWDPKSLSKEQIEDIYIARQLGNIYFPINIKHILNKKHQIDSFLESLDYKDISNYRKEIVLSLDGVDKNNVDGFLQCNNLNNNIVLIHANTGVPNRTWPQQYWSQLIDKFLADGWSVILIGSNNNFYSYKKAVGIDNDRIFNAIDMFSMSETTYLMTKASLLVACDSGPVALAAATNIAICALYSVVPGEFRLPYRHGLLGWNALAIDNPCQYYHCANTYSLDSGETFDAWCPNNKTYSCMKSFTADNLYHEITGFLNSKNYVEQCQEDVEKWHHYHKAR